MATAAQIAANRANAKKSTGPKTPEGKARSSRNACKSPVPSPDGAWADAAMKEVERDVAAWAVALGAEGAVEKALAAQAARAAARLAWIDRADWAATVRRVFEARAAEGAGDPVVRALAPESALVDPTEAGARIERARAAAEASLFQALSALRLARESRPAAVPAPALAPAEAPAAEPPAPAARVEPGPKFVEMAAPRTRFDLRQAASKSCRGNAFDAGQPDPAPAPRARPAGPLSRAIRRHQAPCAAFGQGPDRPGPGRPCGSRTAQVDPRFNRD